MEHQLTTIQENIFNELYFHIEFDVEKPKTKDESGGWSSTTSKLRYHVMKNGET